MKVNACLMKLLILIIASNARRVATFVDVRLLAVPVWEHFQRKFSCMFLVFARILPRRVEVLYCSHNPV